MHKPFNTLCVDHPCMQGGATAHQKLCDVFFSWGFDRTFTSHIADVIYHMMPRRDHRQAAANKTPSPIKHSSGQTHPPGSDDHAARPPPATAGQLKVQYRQTAASSLQGNECTGSYCGPVMLCSSGRRRILSWFPLDHSCAAGTSNSRCTAAAADSHSHSHLDVR